MKKTNLQDIYPLSSLQEGLLFHHLRNPNSSDYFEQISYSLQGDFNLQVFEASWNQLLQRHDILRTVFTHNKAERPLQIVLKKRQLHLNYTDLSMLGKDEQQQQIRAYQQQDRKQGFQLDQDLLLRLHVFQIDADHYRIVWSHHHILLDGWSLSILYREWLNVYQALRQGRHPELPPAIPYLHYVRWQEEQAADAPQQFWQDYLADFSEPTGIPTLPVDQLDNQPSASDSGEYRFIIEGTEYTNLQALARQSQSTLSNLIQALWGILLGRYNQCEDVVFGLTTSIRPSSIPGIDHMVGLLINTIPVRIQAQPELNFKDLLQQLQSSTFERQPHQHYPLHRIQSDSGLRELFDHILVFENYPLDQQLYQNIEDLTGFHIQDIDFPEQVHYPLSVIITPDEQQLRFRLCFNHDRYTTSQFIPLEGHLRQLMRSLCQQPNGQLQDLKWLSGKELVYLTTTLNETFSDYPRNQTIATLLEEQAERHPERIAVSFRDQQLSYRQLNNLANALAWRLREEYAIQANSLVGVMLDRSEQMVLAILAILKAGGAYVPIDPGYPRERINYLLEDTQCRVVLTQHQHQTLAGETPVLLIDRQDKTITETPPNNPPTVNAPSDLAYVIYTSGTTGKPKGVMVPQRGVVRLVKNTNYIQLDETHKILQTGPLAFDASTFEIWGALLNGGSVHITAENELLDIPGLKQTLLDKAITTMWLTSSLCNQLIEHDISLFQTLRYLLVGGERLSPPHIKRLHETYAEIQLINGYGPTENTTFTCCYPIKNVHKGDIPIGRPIANTRVYLLDEQRQPVPIGVSGRLFISGDGLAQGYLNNQPLTDEKFVPCPFESDLPMYDSGDQARWLPDGNIEFLGRRDEQVKIRGFRIECAEVEYALLQHPAINQTVVVPRKLKEGYLELVAYIVGNEPHINLVELRGFLVQQLPDYMLPGRFVQLDSLPLTNNQKVDKHALPDPDEQPASSADALDYVAPTTELERQLANIWQAVLGLEPISVEANYFDLGGDSIKAIQIMARLHKLNLTCDINTFFKYPRILDLAPHIVSSDQAIAQQAVTGDVPLTPVQHWFFHTVQGPKHHFNHALLFMPKSAQSLDSNALQTAVQALFNHHDALRMGFRVTDTDIQQNNRGEQALALECITLTESDVMAALRNHAEQIQQSFDLAQTPLCRAVLFELPDGGQRLLLVLHHLVIDGVSWRILLGDLETAYQQAYSGENIRLPDKTHAFRDWALFLQDYANSADLLEELPYWRQIENKLSTQALPYAQDGSPVQRQQGILKLHLSTQDTSALLGSAHHAYNTRSHDLLLTALAIACNQWHGASSTVISLESHGREAMGDLNISRTLGWFTSIYPVLLDLTGADTLAGRIRLVKETLRQTPNNGLGYGVLKYLKPNSGLKSSGAAIAFNYLGQFDQDLPSNWLELASESIGASVSSSIRLPEDLLLTGMVTGQRLMLELHFDTNLVGQDSAQQLLDYYQQALLAIIQHCAQKTAGEVTPADLGYRGLTLNRYAELLQQWQLPADAIQDVYPLSPMQEGLLFHALYDSHSSAFFQQMHYLLEGPLDIGMVETAWNKLAQRHDILRTRFVHENLAQPLQVVLKDRPIDFRYLDLRQQAQALDMPEHIRALMVDERNQPFDLGKDVLIRITLIREQDEYWHLIWTFHHILLDGWCLGIVYQEFLQIYHALRLQQPPVLKPVRPYVDYIRWLGKQDKQVSVQFWRDYLKGFAQATGIPKSLSIQRNQAIPANKVATWEFNFAQDLTHKLQQIAASNQVTMNTLFQALWSLLLARYNNSHNDVVFGAALAGRPEAVQGVENMVGLFMNSTPVRVQFFWRQNFHALLQNIQDQNLQIKPHGHFPLSEIQAQSSLKQSLFDHLLVYENYPAVAALEQAEQKLGCRLSVSDNVYREVNYDLTLLIHPAEQLNVLMLYNPLSYTARQMQTLSACMQQLASQVAANPQTLLQDLHLIPPAHGWHPMQLAPGSLNHAFLAYTGLDAAATAQVRLLDKQEQVVPENVPGEVYLSTQVATQQNTGFSACWLEDGRLQLLQEPDNYLIIHQEMFTMDQLTTALNQHPAITEHALLRLRDKQGQGFLLVVAATHQPLDSDQLTAYMQSHIQADMLKRLAVYLVPALPLNEQGQLDRERILANIALSEPGFSSAGLEAAILADLQELDDVAILLEAEIPHFPPLHLSDLFQNRTNYLAELLPEDDLPEDDQTSPNDPTAAHNVMAFADGGEVLLNADEPITMVDALYRAARDYGDRGTVYVNEQGEEHYQSYADLLREASCILHGLHTHGLKAGDTVILQQQDLYDHLTCFWACILGGIRPVTVATSPTYAQKTSVVNKLYNAWQLLQQPLVFASPHLVEPIEGLNALFGTQGLKAISVSAKDYTPITCDYRAKPDDIAFYQLTSGSTGVPKCIQERNKGIYYHVHGASQYNAYTHDDVYLTWPPSDHVGALITLYIKAVYLGVKQLAVNTDLILNNPLKWLDLLEAHRVTFTWSPNFGYKLVSEHLKKTNRRWDLSSVRFFMNAAEQVTFPVVEEFLHLVKDFGVPEKAMQPAYGMAETCTAMQYKNDFTIADGFHWFDKSSLKGILQKTDDRGKDSVSFVKLGKPMPGVQIRIVDEKQRLVPEGKIGSLHIRGEVITPGYLHNPEANAEAFVGDDWFNTGDLGFILNGELSISGRQKEVIIIRATNFYCYEIEDVVNRVEGVEPTFVGSSAINDPASGSEGLAIFYVPQEDTEPLVLQKAIRARLAQECGINPAYVIPMEKDAFPKTTSGKIQRVQLREALEKGEFNAIIRELDLELANERTLPDWFFKPTWQRKQLAQAEANNPPVDVLLSDDAALRDALQPTIWVHSNTQFSRQDSGIYTIDPDNPTHYRQLMDDLKAEGQNPVTLVHTWSASKQQTEPPNKLACNGFSLLYLIQAAIPALPDLQHLLVLGSNTQSVLDSDPTEHLDGSLRGMLKTLAQEQPGVRCAYLDIDNTNPTEATSCIHRELEHKLPAVEVAYRNGQRFVSCLEKIAFDPFSTSIPLRNNGLYVITGGLGGIGVEIAQLLQTQYQAHLILTGRNPLDASEEKAQSLNRLQKNSDAYVAYHALDVCDTAGLKQVIQQAESRCGEKLAGILHLAGESGTDISASPDAHYLVNESAEQLSKLMHSKAHGTASLLTCLQDYPDTVFIGFSSVNAYFGGVGAGAYAAANACLESAVHAFNSRHAGTGQRAYSMAWSLWDGIGMSKHHNQQQAVRAKGFHVIILQQGLHAFLAAVEAGQEQLIIGLDANNLLVQGYMQPVPLTKQELAAYYTLKPGQDDDEDKILGHIDALAKGWQPALLTSANTG